MGFPNNNFRHVFDRQLHDFDRERTEVWRVKGSLDLVCRDSALQEGGSSLSSDPLWRTLALGNEGADSCASDC